MSPGWDTVESGQEGESSREPPHHGQLVVSLQGPEVWHHALIRRKWNTDKLLMSPQTRSVLETGIIGRQSSRLEHQMSWGRHVTSENPTD